MRPRARCSACPTAPTRTALLERLLRNGAHRRISTSSEIADRTPGFVVADLAALVREAALRAAARASADGEPPKLTQDDLLGALNVIRPLSRSATEEVALGIVTLDDVGDMVETKQALTEAVLWPLQHPGHLRPARCSTRRAGCCCTARPDAARPSWSARWPAPGGSACTPSKAPS